MKKDKIQKKKNKPISKFKEDIIVMVSVTTNIKGKEFETFMIFSIGMGLTLAILVISIVELPVAIFTGIVAMCMPFIFLKSKLQIKRAGNSREGEILVSELIANYKISYCNITEAIETTAKLIEDAPHSKALLFDLALGLNTAVSKEEVNKLLDNFKQSIGTIWADVLATNLYFAITQGINISRSLQDLSEGLIRSRRLVEYNKRGINEATMMLKFLGPVCMILTVICAVNVFGMPIEKYLFYQFGTETGLTWFLLVVFSYVIGVGVNVYFGSKKLDL